MLRKLQILSFALLATLAIASPIGAPAASAAEFHVQVPSEITADLTGTGLSNAIDMQFGELKCTTVKYDATGEAHTFSALTVTPSYEGCTLAGAAATVDMNGCIYTLHLEEGPPYKGPLDILCETGQEITITGGAKCTIHIPSQEGLGPIAYENVGAGLT
ncbi:MAG TPA: hypothetical protein VFX85_04685, partial [Solirubrobacterales bacterium]|nr:hypothetical protein [Solirubrobacterales bacterium]